MASKKKNKKKSTKPKKRASRKATPAKKQARKKTTAKKSAKKADASNKAVAKSLKKTTTRKTAKAVLKRTRIKNQERDSSLFLRRTMNSRSGEQSGDLQGLSNVETADSESVDELLEEGNAFEAEAVAGVEYAEEHDEREVRTREVPEDDVPDEYLDEQ